MALIAVLAILAFLTVIVVGITVAMRMESEAAHSYQAKTEAEMLVREGVEYVKASLKSMADAGASSWATAPGEISFLSNGTPRLIPLSSGTSVNTNANAGVYKAFDLNRRVLSQDQLCALTGTAGGADSLWVGWIYVHQSGLHETNQAPTLDLSDPIVGRFAYWADDESSRIDLNTAWGTVGNTNTLNHPSRVSLTNLFGSAFATMIYTNATNRPFVSPDDARRLDPVLASAISSNRFSLTHYTFSPNLNPWGQPKIVLTTQASRTNGTGSTNYLNILTNPNTDPGLYANLNGTKVTAAVSNLTALLRTNRPYFTRSFSQKYDAANSTSRTAQMAVDIIDYVRAAESTNAIIEPLRGALNGTAYLFSAQGSAGKFFFGTSRHPLLTQMGLLVSDTPVAGRYEAQIVMTLYLPPHYGGSATSIPIAGNSKVILQYTGGGTFLGWSSHITPGDIPGADLSVLGTDPLVPGSSCVVVAHVSYPGSVADLSYPVRPSFSNPDSAVWDTPILNSTDPALAACPVTLHHGPLPTPTLGQSMILAETRDPRTSKFATDWTNITDNLGQPPAIWSSPTSLSPPQDTESDGSVATNDLYMPPFKGQVENPSGGVRSVAELGHIFTGGSTNGVPWRTLRLQPSANNNIPPDWALLDLFQIPFQGTNNPEIYQPYSNTVAGRINVNSGMLTNGVVLATNASARLAPLAALLQSATNMSVTLQATAVSNIASMKPAANGTNYGIPMYLSPAEIAETAGVADGGEASEANLQGVIDLATAQGSVFRIHAVGQSLKQTPLGQLVIQAEQYKEVLVRSYNPTWTNGATLLWKSIPQ